MTQQQKLPPGIRPTDKVVLFDGVCTLCSAWARFLIRFDHKQIFKLATVQSAEGQAILKWFGLPTDTYKTMILIEDASLYTKSTAFFRVMMRLPLPWPITCVGWIVPAFLRNWFYDRIALNRYLLFGRNDTCVMPTKDHSSRFLNGQTD
ncbi:thiol-disulfide oxidoreductase DCC family protein [Zooshikella sp. RANM57]|uniref:thiol-disulfide oxidoreductase DCC family protein n=1 Tax=Zooshikella sp. RANM57 TaxID=3425863 RepID=UPI003D7012E8